MSLLTMRIVKYPHLPGVGVDIHKLTASNAPHGWGVVMSTYGSTLVFGKFTSLNTITEYQMDALQGHDWGAMQPHIPIPPVPIAAPDAPLLMLGSSHKHFLSAYTVVESVGGGLLAAAGGATDAPVAVGLPTCMIPVQDCNFPIGLPTGLTFHVPTSRWIGFGVWDLLAAAVGLITDVIVDFASGLIMDDFLPEGLAGAAVGAMLGAVSGVVGDRVAELLPMDSTDPADQVIVLVVCAMLGPIGTSIQGGNVADLIGQQGRHPRR